MHDLPELPFPVTASDPGDWRQDEASGALVARAGARTDLYVNPAGPEPAAAESTLSPATLLGTPPDGDWQLSAHISVDFQAQYDAGVLLVWGDEAHWAKFCFEFSPAGQPMVVSVVTVGVSDDANAFVVPDRSIWLRVSRIGRVYAFHASTDATTWQLIRVFTLGDPVSGHTVGFEAQSPTGDGCTVTFDQIRFTGQQLEDLRDGS